MEKHNMEQKVSYIGPGAERNRSAEEESNSGEPVLKVVQSQENCRKTRPIWAVNPDCHEYSDRQHAERHQRHGPGNQPTILARGGVVALSRNGDRTFMRQAIKRRRNLTYR
jgi:hypothetical protein